MPSVISKFLDKSEKAFNKNQSLLSSAIIGAALATYAYKIGYPLVESYISKPNTEGDGLNNNLVKSNGVSINGKGQFGNQNGVTQSNGVVQSHGDPKTQSAMLKRNRLMNSIPNFNLAFILQFIKLVSIYYVNLFHTGTTCY